jgi:hypothetical protein
LIFIKVYSQYSNVDFIDSTVAGISLLNSKSLKALGDLKYDNEEGNGFKVGEFYNKSKNELLIITIDPVTHQITEYCFYYLNSKKHYSNIYKLKRDKFVSGKGVLLGMSEDELLHCLGKPSRVELHGHIHQFEYVVTDKQFPYLKRHNAEKYLSNYKFVQNKLIEVQVQLFMP